MKGLLRSLRYDWPLHFVLLLTNWLPDNVIFLRLRGALARPFFGSCGPDLRLGRNLTFYNPSRISIGKSTYIAFGCWFMAGARIDIGDEVMFGPYCAIASSNHTSYGGSFRYGVPQQAPIKIGKGSWLASHVIVTAGSQVGEGTAIAGGAAVKGAVPASVVAGGVPARVLKTIPMGEER